MKSRDIFRRLVGAFLAALGAMTGSCSEGPQQPVATLPDAASDADPSCPCAPIEVGIPLPTGQIPLPCYCSKSDWPLGIGSDRPACRTYEALLSCPVGIPYIYVETYTNCNLVKIGYASSTAVDFDVFDATTHELVGAMRGHENIKPPPFTCNSRRANVITAGTIPGPECAVKAFEEPCWPPRTDDAGPPGGGLPCGCQVDEKGVVYWSDIACACGGQACPRFDKAMSSCTAPATYEFDLVETHAACNLVVVKIGAEFYRLTFVYDRTTHAVVGASFAPTVNVVRDCGMRRITEYRAGQFPPADCPVTESIRRCPRDGG